MHSRLFDFEIGYRNYFANARTTVLNKQKHQANTEKTYMHNTHKFLLIAKQCMEVIVWRRKLREIKEDTAQAQNDHICIKLEFTRSYCEMVLWRLSKLADIVDVFFFICMDNYELATCVVFRSKLMVIVVWNENTQTEMLSWWHSSKKKPATKLIQCRSYKLDIQ